MAFLPLPSCTFDAVYVADVHLSARSPILHRAFLAFLAQIHSKALYILGDFIDGFLGRAHFDPYLPQVLSAIKTLPMPVYMMRGNRDILLHHAFCRDMHAHFLQDVCMHNGVVMCHGDTLCLDDTRYQRYRAIISNPLVQYALHHAPTPWLNYLKKSLSRNGKAHTVYHAHPDAIYKLYTQFSSTNPPIAIVHGHTHTPYIHTERTPRLVLGDWRINGACVQAVVGARIGDKIDLFNWEYYDV